MPLSPLSNCLAPLGASRAVASTWLPTDLSGLALWLRADLGLYQDSAGVTPVTADGDQVGRWSDQSGNSRHATQATSGNRPVYKAAIVNGQPVMRLTAASSHYWSLPDTFTGLTAAEIFVVVKIATDPPATAAKSGIWRFGSETFFGGNHYPYTDGVIYDAFGSTGRKTAGNPTPSLASWRLYSVISRSGEWTALLDGTQLFTTASNTVGWTTAPTLGRGDNSASGNFHLDGDIAEVILYDAKQTTPHRQLVKDYLAARYGLTLA